MIDSIVAQEHPECRCGAQEKDQRQPQAILKQKPCNCDERDGAAEQTAQFLNDSQRAAASLAAGLLHQVVVVVMLEELVVDGSRLVMQELFEVIAYEGGLHGTHVVEHTAHNPLQEHEPAHDSRWQRAPP